MSHFHRSGYRLALCLFISLFLYPPSIGMADHGPGTSGGGTSTQSAQTLKPGKSTLSDRLEFTEFRRNNRFDLHRKANKAGSFDGLSRSFLHTVDFSHGLLEDLQLSVSLGYYDAVNTREAEQEIKDGEVETEIHDFKPDGLTDLWLSAKYRFYNGPKGQFAVFGGVKFPVGRDRVKNSAGEFIEPSAAAGSGAYDARIGLAHSRWLTQCITLDTSAQYTRRGQAHRFKLGDRIDAGVVLSFRLTEDLDRFPRVSLFTEANLRYLFENQNRGSHSPNTGGTALFLSPGVRVHLAKNLSFTVAPQFPVVQNLNGEQQRTKFKIVTAFEFSF